MKKLLTVIKREYLTRVRTKGFIIGTLLMPVFILGVTILPVLVGFIQTEEQKKIAVIDMSRLIFDELAEKLDQTNDAGERIYLLKKLAVTPQNLEAVKQSLREDIDQGKFFGLLYIPEDVLERNQVEFYAKNVSNLRQNEEIRNAVTTIITEKRILHAGLDPESVKKLTRRVSLKTFKVGPGGKEREEKGQTFVIAYILVLFLYMALILYGTYVMRAVIEEKTSRVVEVLVSSIRPFYLMAGKILGVGSVGLTQFLIWSIAAGLIVTYTGLILKTMGFSVAAEEFPVPDVGIIVLVYFVVFFVLGYILYATMYAGIGALANSDQEGQQLQMTVTMFLIVPIIMMTYIIANPNSTTSVVLSLIPIFSPIIMFTRIVVDIPPFHEILASILLLGISIYFLILITARIFRVGILMYGKRPTLPEVLRWIRYP